MTTRLAIPAAAFSMEEPWRIPPGVGETAMCRAVDGGPPRLPTFFSVYRDASWLTVLFQGNDDHVVATKYGYDQPLYEEDVYEVFLAPGGLREYFEIEVSPVGTLFDAKIESPDGHRGTMRTSLDWTCRDLFAAVLRTPASFSVVLRIPFASLEVASPAPGSEWRANFFRIDRHPSHGDEFLAWRPTLRQPADFHVTAAFGTLQFE